MATIRQADELFAELTGRGPAMPGDPRVLFVFAHPDDEAVGAASLVQQLPRAHYVYLTDGAPRHGGDAQAAGFATSAEYARQRRVELQRALTLAGVSNEQLHALRLPDQEATQHLPAIAREIAVLCRTLQPEYLVTHPFEGGHPDHDAAAFASHAAVRRLTAHGEPAPSVIETTSYHNRGGSLAWGEFLPEPSRPVVTIALDANQQAFKRALIGCHTSQARVLASARLDCERFRLAPHYTFTEPPHRGTLLYELFPWDMTWLQWQQWAQAACIDLGIADGSTPETTELEQQVEPWR